MAQHDVVASLEARYEYSIGSTLVGDLLGLNEDYLSDVPPVDSARLQRSEAARNDDGTSPADPCSPNVGQVSAPTTVFTR